MEHAVAFAETGHLAISTLHANNANQALDRIINFFPEERKAQLLHDLGNNIRAIVSQRLVTTVDGKRCAAIEILLGSHTIKQMIMKDQLSDIKEAMLKSENQGMKTFDSSLFDLARSGKITEEEALKNADSMNNLRLRFKLSTPLSKDSESNAPNSGNTTERPPAALSPEAEKINLAMLSAEKAKAKLMQIRHAQSTRVTADNTKGQSSATLMGNGGSAANDQNRSQASSQRPTNGGIELSLMIDEEPDDSEPETSVDEQNKDKGLFGMGKLT
jgi:twitching motility protein PilU